MHDWIMPIYIMTGVAMAIGVYLTIRYRPYCTLKSPELEIAMELHRKRIMNESMSSEEIEQNNLYKKQTKKFSLGYFLLFTVTLFHMLIMTSNAWLSLSPIYYLCMVCLSILYVTANSSTFPYCYTPFLGVFLWNYDNDDLATLNVYSKKYSGKNLDEDELRVIVNEGYALKFFAFYRFAINLGVVLHLSLDVWYGLNGSLIIK